jgi:hypothetical protein
MYIRKRICMIIKVEKGFEDAGGKDNGKIAGGKIEGLHSEKRGN